MDKNKEGEYHAGESKNIMGSILVAGIYMPYGYLFYRRCSRLLSAGLPGSFSSNNVVRVHAPDRFTLGGGRAVASDHPGDFICVGIVAGQRVLFEY